MNQWTGSVLTPLVYCRQDATTRGRTTPSPDVVKKLLLESLCKKGEQCTCVGSDARFCPGGRQLYETGAGPEALRGHGPVLAPEFYPRRDQGPDLALQAPETRDRDGLFDWVLEQFDARKKFLDTGGFKGAKDLCTALLVAIGPPGVGKSHVANELSRQRCNKLIGLLGEDLVVSVCTFNFGMPVKESDDTLLFRFAFGAFANMAPMANVEKVLGVADNETPQSTVPKCPDMVTDFSKALESWRSKLEENGYVYNPAVQDMPSILKDLYARPKGANVLIITDEISKTKDKPINKALRAQAESIRQVLLNTDANVYLLTTALWGQEEQIMFVTGSQNIVLPKYLLPLRGPSVQELVTDCDGGIKKDLLKLPAVRAVLKLAAGNPRLVEYTRDYLRRLSDAEGKTVSEAGQRVADEAAGEQNATGTPFMTIARWAKEVRRGKTPLPDTTTAAALAYVLRKPEGERSSPTEVDLDADTWDDELLNAIGKSSLIIYELYDDYGRPRNDSGRLDVLPLALLRFAQLPNRRTNLRHAAAAAGLGASGYDELERVLEFLEGSYLFQEAPSSDFADPSERIVMFLYALGISRGGRFAKAVLGETVADAMNLTSKGGIPIGNIVFTPWYDIRDSRSGKSGNEKRFADFDACVIGRRRILDKMVYFLEAPPRYPGIDFVIIANGEAFPVQVKRDPLVWSLDYAPAKAKERIDKLTADVNTARGSNGPFLDAAKHTRFLEKLRLCNQASEKLKKKDILSKFDVTDPVFTLEPGAFFGFDTADIRQEFELLRETTWPDCFVDVTAVERDVPLGLLEVATLTGEAWLGGLDDSNDDDVGDTDNNSGDQATENVSESSPGQV